MRVFFVCVLLIVSLAVALSFFSGEAEGTGPFNDLAPVDFWVITSAGESFTLVPGYIYTIEVIGSRGSTGSGPSDGNPPGAGGNGTKILVWIDLRVATNPIICYGGTTAGGSGGIVQSNNGGSGGRSAYVLYDSGDLMMVAGGGGGGGSGGQGGGSGGGQGGAGGNAGGQGVAGSGIYTTSDYIVYNGTPIPPSAAAHGAGGNGLTGGAGGTGSGGTAPGSPGGLMVVSGTNVNGGGGGNGGASGAAGGGGGGAGYTGGGGGVSGNSWGGGSGGGSSYININPIYGLSESDYAFSPSSDVTARVTVTQYGPPVLSGTVKFVPKYGAGPISEAVIEYNIDGGTPQYLLTDSNGNYSITVFAGTKVTITGVNKHLLDCVTPLPADFTMNTHHTGVDFEMDLIPGTFGVVGNVTHDTEGFPISGAELKVEYDDKSIGSWFTGPDGSYVIPVMNGDTVTILDVSRFGYIHVSGAIPSATFDDAASDIDFTMDYDTTYDFSITGRIILNDPYPDPESLYLNGSPLADVCVEYTIDGIPGTVMTNSFGRYTIYAPAGSTVVITDVTSFSYEVNEAMPSPFLMKDDWSDVDFTMSHMKPFYYIRGTVKDIHGHVLYGASVEYSWLGGDGYVHSSTASANEHGEYEIAIPVLYGDGNVLMTDVTYPGYILDDYYPTGYPNYPIPSYYSGVNFVLKELFVVRAQVLVDSGPGLPLEWATVEYEVYNSGGVLIKTDQVFTNQHGTCEIHAVEGQEVIITAVSKTGYSLSPFSMYTPPSVFTNTAHPEYLMDFIGQFTVSGTVTLDDGVTSIGGVSIDFEITNGGVISAGSTMTFSDGTYEIVAFNLGDEVSVIDVRKADYTLVTTLPVSGDPFLSNTANVDFEMIKGVFTVTGTVTNEADGSVLSGVSVAYNIDGVGHTFIFTDAAGKYTISALIGEEINVTGVTLSGWFLNNTTFLPGGPFIDNDIMDFEMYKPFAVTGTVTNEIDGSALFGVLIAYDIDGVAQTPVSIDSAGEYTLSALIGEEIYITGVTLSGWFLNTSTVLPVGPFTDDDTQDFEMFKPFTVTGTVTNEVGGSALSGVSIAYDVDGVSQTSVLTNVAGEYILTALVGEEINITGVTLSGWTLNASTVPPAGPFIDDAVQDYEMYKPFTVTGTVTNEVDGSVLSGVSIAYDVDGVSQTPVSTDTAGEYTLTALIGEEINITGVTLSGWTLNVSTVLPAGPFIDDDTQDFEMYKPFTVTGTVTNEVDGSVLSGVSIAYDIDGVAQTPISTDAVGAYTLTALIGEEMNITGVTLSGWTLNASTVLPVGPFTDDASQDFEMFKPFIVTGTVTNAADGFVLPGVTIVYNIDGVSQSPVYTDAFGEYTLTALIGEEISITDVILSGRTLNALTVLPVGPFTDDATQDFLMYTPFTVTGMVTNEADGSVLSGVAVAYDIDGVSQPSVLTDAAGEYVLGAFIGEEINITGVTLRGWTLNASTVLPAGPFDADDMQDFRMFNDTVPPSRGTESGGATIQNATEKPPSQPEEPGREPAEVEEPAQEEEVKNEDMSIILLFPIAISAFFFIWSRRKGDEE